MIVDYKKSYRKLSLTQIISNDFQKDVIDNMLLLIDTIKPKKIGLYKSLQHEIDILPIIKLFTNLTFACPKIKDDEVDFYSFDQETLFHKNPKYNFFEPDSDKVIIPDMIFVPALYFDSQGYRLGFGKGHYDKYFADRNMDYNATLVGICNSIRMKPFLPKEIHDIRMDYIIFDKNILKL
jgi:5-formyltetrahydrofolate cyclo-ligase